MKPPPPKVDHDKLFRDLCRNGWDPIMATALAAVPATDEHERFSNTAEDDPLLAIDLAALRRKAA